MIVLAVVIALLLIINLVPLGVDAGYSGDGVFVSARVWLLSLRLFPVSEEKKQKTQERKKAKAARVERKKAKSGADKAENKPEKPKKKLDKDFIFALVKMGLHALKRFRHRLSVDLFRLHIVFGGDPYSAAMGYGYASTAFGTVLPLLDEVLNIGERDVNLSVDFDAQMNVYDARLILTIQLWEIVYIGAAFAVEFIRYKISRKKADAKERRPETAQA